MITTAEEREKVEERINELKQEIRQSQLEVRALRKQLKIKPCSIEGCDSRVFAKTWCNKHYNRYYRYGDPLYLKRKVKGTAKSDLIREWIKALPTTNEKLPRGTYVAIAKHLGVSRQLVAQIVKER